MILSPETRSLYTDALTPPAGYKLDKAIAATFSLDLNTLLSVPIQLVLQSTENREELLRDQIALHEALQRAAEMLHVFTQVGRVQAPTQHPLLYSLLEKVIIEVKAPKHGAFHPKIWLLRFLEDDGSDTKFRLMLPSKNLTADRSWDVALTLDGLLGDGENHNGVILSEFVERLPDLAVGSFTPPDDYIELVADLRNVMWELPDGFDELSFYPLGLGGPQWRPKKNSRLAVISPFIRQRALDVLAKTSVDPVAIVSRPESLAELSTNLPFMQAYVLHDTAETDDGEDIDEDPDELGLHAKVYVYESEKRTHIALGSANATNAALINNSNVEILAELAGPTRLVGTIEALLDSDNDVGLGKYLVHWKMSATDVVDSVFQQNQQTLEASRNVLLEADLSLNCCESDGNWVLELKAKNAPDLQTEVEAMTWPVTTSPGNAVSMTTLFKDGAVVLPVSSLESLTSLVAFRLGVEKQSLSFTLNLPVTGMPEERDRAILRSIINNRSGFLRYLLLLLAGLGDGAGVGTVARAFSAGNAEGQSSLLDDIPLLEELVRAFSREPERLQKVRRLVDDITADGEASKILPEGFLDLWQVFEEAMAANE